MIYISRYYTIVLSTSLVFFHQDGVSNSARFQEGFDEVLQPESNSPIVANFLAGETVD